MSAMSPAGKLSLLGSGWITSLGSDPKSVWQQIRAGGRPESDILRGLYGRADAPYFPVPVPGDGGFSRMRRSSAISCFALAAATAALDDAGRAPAGRTALILASSNGAVIYTRKFFTDVLERGTGSPIFFPETVYNAPASHLAARFGIDTTALTFVGDASAGTDALVSAADLIGSGAADRCLVVAAEEADWLVYEAARYWGCAGGEGRPVFSEGAVALLVGAPGGAGPQLSVHPGLSCNRSLPVRDGLVRIFQDLSAGGPPDLLMLSASGSRIDFAERSAADLVLPDVPRMEPKRSLGEAFAVSTLAQVVCAALAVQSGLASRAAVSIAGWSGQLGGVAVNMCEP